MKKRSSKKLPKFIYAAYVKLGGEVGLAKCERYEPDEAWYEDVDDGKYPIVVFKLGLEDTGSKIQFSSTSEDEVERWLCGVRSVMLLMHRWAAPNNPSSKGR